jgi:hypothetical protein
VSLARPRIQGSRSNGATLWQEVRLKMKLALAVVAVAATLASTGRAAAAMKYRVYRSPKYGYSMVVPTEWEERKEKDGTTTFTGSTGVLVVNVRPRAGCTPETLPAYAAQFVVSEKIKLLNKGPRTAGGSRGFMFQYQTKEATDTLRGDTICLLNEDSLLILAFVTRDWLYDASRVVFEKAIASMKLFAPEGVTPLAQGFRRFEDLAHGFRLQVPAAWQTTQGNAAAPTFAGDDGTLQILVDTGARYLPGDTEILAKAYVNRARYKLAHLASGKLDGQPAQFAYCELPDKPDWGACFIVFVRAERLHVLKIAYHQTRRKDLVQEIAGSFQFLGTPAAPRKPTTKLSRTSNEKTP